MKEFVSGEDFIKIMKDCKAGIISSDKGYKELMMLISRIQAHGKFSLENNKISFYPNMYSWTYYSFQSSSVIKMGSGERMDRDKELRDAMDEEIELVRRIVIRLNETFDQYEAYGDELREFFTKRELYKEGTSKHKDSDFMSNSRYYRLKRATEWAIKKEFHLFSDISNKYSHEKMIPNFV